MTDTKRKRQQAILELIKEHPITTQTDLVRELRRRGHPSDQSTISRDLRELGVIRAPHQGRAFRYELPPRSAPSTWQGLSHLIGDLVIRVDGNDSLLVLKTTPGGAPLVAADIDRIDSPDVVGTVAGDDVVLIIPRTRKARKDLEDRLRGMMG